MSCRVDSQPWIAGACLVGDYGLGVLGSEVPASGVDGGGFGYPDLELPADANAEVRWLILRWPSAGTLTPQENSQFSFTGAPDGAYFFDVEGFRDGLSIGVKRVHLLVGPQYTLLQLIHTELNPLATGKAWYSVNEAQAASGEDPYPFIVVQRVGSDPNVSLQGASNLQNTRLSIEIHARTILEADALKRSVEAAMAEWTVTNVPLSSLDIFEEAVGVHRIVMDYSIWSIY